MCRSPQSRCRVARYSTAGFGGAGSAVAGSNAGNNVGSSIGLQRVSRHAGAAASSACRNSFIAVSIFLAALNRGRAASLSRSAASPPEKTSTTSQQQQPADERQIARQEHEQHGVYAHLLRQLVIIRHGQHTRLTLVAGVLCLHFPVNFGQLTAQIPRLTGILRNVVQAPRSVARRWLVSHQLVIAPIERGIAGKFVPDRGSRIAQT